MTHTCFCVPTSENFPRHLARSIADSGGHDFSRTTILIPSLRLAYPIRYALSRLTAACIPPQIATLDNFSKSIPRASSAILVNDIEKRIILSHLLREMKLVHFSEGQETELAAFFNEIAEEGVGTDFFVRLREMVDGDPFRDETHLARLHSHYDELRRLRLAYFAFFKAHNLQDASGLIWDIAGDDADIRLHSQPERCIIAGFANAPTAHIAFLKKLGQTCSLEFWIQADPFDFATPADSDGTRHPQEPLTAFISAFKPEMHFIDKNAAGSENAKIMRLIFDLEKGTRQQHNVTSIHVHSAATPVFEAKAAASLVRNFITEGNLQPHEITIAIPGSSYYGRLIQAALSEAGIPANHASGIPFYETRLGQWVRLFLEIAVYNWKLKDILSLFTNPFTAKWLVENNFESSPAKLQQLVYNFATRHDIPSGRALFLAQLKKDNEAHHGANSQADPELEKFFLLLESSLVALTGNRADVLSGWAEKTWQTLAALQLEKYAIIEKGRSYNLGLNALKALFQHLQKIQHIGSSISTRFSFRDFYRILSQNIFMQPIRPVGQPLVGVQVLHLQEAAALSSKKLIILGNIEGIFPGWHLPELFIPQAYRAELGLTTFRSLEKNQDQLFYNLASRTADVHLFYSRQIDETPTVKSRYIKRLELLQTMGSHTFSTLEEDGRLLMGDFMAATLTSPPDFMKPGVRRLERETRARADLRGLFMGDRKLLLRTLSAHSIEDLLFCPYRFLLSKTGFSERALPDTELDAPQTGSWLHKVCEHFFTGLNWTPEGAADLAAPWKMPITPENYEQALQRLASLTRILMDKNRPRLDYLYHMHYVGWPKYLEAEKARGAADFNPGHFEHQFEKADYNILKAGAGTAQIIGRIDRISQQAGKVRIIDYKLRHAGPSKKEIAAGKAPQLPLYVHMLKQNPSFKNCTDWDAEYFVLWSGEQKVVGDNLGKQELAAGWENMQELLAGRADALLQNQALEPIENQTKCSFCDFAGVCRKEEPDYQKSKPE